MAHLGARAFEEIGGEVVQTTRLSEIGLIRGRMPVWWILAVRTQLSSQELRTPPTAKENFKKIPCPVAYWVSEAILKAFESWCIALWGTQ
jgi:hypothetical protein